MSSTPRQLGRYRLGQLLGRGGMGEVRLATAVGAAGFEKPVVVKVLRPRLARSPERTGRLLREGLIGVRLDHENIVEVLDLGEEKGLYYVVMEYVRGYTVAHLVAHAAARRSPIPVRAAVHIARGVAAALEHVHEHTLGLAHRDVSPSNVLVGQNGRVKLADFGIAALAADETDPGPLTGKPAFLPPEAFRGSAPTQAWDLYALGVVLWEMLATRRAFPGDDHGAIVAAVQQGLSPASVVRAEAPPALAALVDRAVATDPAARFASARELRGALDQAVPRAVDDPEWFREWVENMYADKSFVEQHGNLPTTTVTVRLGVPRAPREKPMEGETADVPASPPLRFGLTPALGVGTARSTGDRLAARMQRDLGRPVKPIVVADYQALVDALAGGDVDLAWMPPAVFVDAEDRGATALVLARRAGRTSYDSAIFVRDDSPIRAIADLRGQSIAWVDRASTAGYLFALAEIARHLGSPDQVLGRQHFHGSHRAVCEAVLNGWAVAGATYATRDAEGRVTSAGWLDALGTRAAEIRAIAFTAPIPADNIAVRPDFPDELADVIAESLIALSGDEDGRRMLRDLFNADGLVRAGRDIYDAVRATLELAKAVG